MQHPQVDRFKTYLVTECGLAAASVEAYVRDLTGLANHLRRRGASLDSFTAEDAREHLRSQALLGHGPATVSRRIASIRAFLKFQTTTGRDTAAVAAGMDAPKRGQPLPNVMGRQQTAAVVASPAKPRDAAILEVLYATGIRASELCGLLLNDLNLTHGFVRVLGKGSKERLVPLSEPAINSLRRYIPTRPAGPTQHVFLSETGHQMNRVDLWRIVKRAGSTVGREISPHTLRHCFASHLLSGGADLRVVQELLGHTSVTTTQVYTHVDMVRLKAIHALHPRQ
jgi:integrase/recombinase XerD